MGDPWWNQFRFKCGWLGELNWYPSLVKNSWVYCEAICHRSVFQWRKKSFCCEWISSWIYTNHLSSTFSIARKRKIIVASCPWVCLNPTVQNTVKGKEWLHASVLNTKVSSSSPSPQRSKEILQLFWDCKNAQILIEGNTFYLWCV
jgi:hypothetical protein